jgi:nucleoside 2-deoxyribosyltransferase
MKVKKIYLAGCVKNTNDYEKTFSEAEIYVRDMGYDVFNPVEYIKSINAQTASDKAIMMLLIPELMKCDGIYMIPGWESSNGSNLEYAIAQYLINIGIDFYIIKE